ncbi:2Fe-2S ferredoxin-type domain-containing protein [Cantharellus anzutake]|uniref:2Fe-2S ferredoxin-type domain-containing protein n=1 Tax=Cantharellus anzutake TaxID=1750568 RepID=UPI001905C3D4|nr:2Fe-2S ferredoxin-type domain-containing protein [Cantharellus anzutake]KAF8333101.1 2Fe-2S ferredoxin-type domain-containing protein [Cantharellus anzutake]
MQTLTRQSLQRCLVTPLRKALPFSSQKNVYLSSSFPRTFLCTCLRVASLPASLPTSCSLHTSQHRSHGQVERPISGTGLKVHFKDPKGNHLKTVEANEGDSLLDLAKEYDVDLEGACEGSVACSTCHVILTAEYYDKLPEPEDDENDMLDMAFGLTDTSRLGCQVKMSRELDGLIAQLPSATRNMFVDGAKPAKH